MQSMQTNRFQNDKDTQVCEINDSRKILPFKIFIGNISKKNKIIFDEISKRTLLVRVQDAF